MIQYTYFPKKDSMGIQYHYANDIEIEIKRIAEKLGLDHLNFDLIKCVRSSGSKSRYTLARCHTMSRIFQKALGIKPHYIIEVISENFDKLPKEEQIKTLIHELLHIPKAMGGGFRHHDYVNTRTINELYNKYVYK